MTRVAINGFGRIGRAILRSLLTRDDAIEIVAINDIAGPETCAYLLEFDSVYGPCSQPVQLEGDTLCVGHRRIRLTAERDLSALDLSGVDLVLECTGKAEDRYFAEAGLRAGAARVLVSGPSSTADLTYVLGVNEGALGDQRVVSNASCTTNALGPLLKALDDEYGIVSGHMTTIHCYTGSQPTVDAARGGPLERHRAAALSMVPTSTSAGRLIEGLLPDLAGKVTSCAVRVPTASVSAIDLTVVLQTPPAREALNSYLTVWNPGVIGSCDRPLVSSDLRGRPESLILAVQQTHVMPGGLVRIFGWYDNEMGFAHRMIDAACRMTS